MRKLVYTAHTLELGPQAEVDGRCVVLQTSRSHVWREREGFPQIVDFFDWLVLVRKSAGVWVVDICVDPAEPAGDVRFEARIYNDDLVLLNGESGVFTLPDVAGRKCSERFFPDRDGLTYRIDSDVAGSRLAVCEGCSELADGVCGACGCGVAGMVWLPTKECPLGKWGAMTGSGDAPA